MRIYIAGRYSRREELLARAEYLKSIGHEITSRWLQGAHEIESDANSDADRIRFAREDFDDLIRADACVSFTETPREGKPSRGGRHVEFGMALATGKRLVVVGPRENVFHWLPTIEWYPDWTEFSRGDLLKFGENP